MNTNIHIMCAILGMIGAFIITSFAAREYDSHPAFAYGILVALSAVFGAGWLAKAMERDE